MALKASTRLFDKRETKVKEEAIRSQKQRGGHSTGFGKLKEDSEQTKRVGGGCLKLAGKKRQPKLRLARE